MYESGPASKPWYAAGKRGDEARDLLNGTVTRIWNLDVGRLDRYEKYFKLYGGTRLVSIKPWEQPTDILSVPVTDTSIEGALRLNVCKAATDTITSKVGKARPRPTFLTQGGDFKLKRKAKGLQQFADGAYHQSDAYELGADMFRDAMIFGTGILHPYGADGRIAVERVFPWELFVDPSDAIYGKPRCLYRVKYIAVQTALDQFGYEGRAQPGGYDDTTHPGYVRVVEAWCLPVERVTGSKRSAKGRHMLLVGDLMVDDSEWANKAFPFVFFHWSKPIQGFWGDSALREVIGIQTEINKLLQSIQEAMHKVGKPWVIKLKDAILTPQELTNINAQIIEVDPAGLKGRGVSEAVQVVTFQSIHPQVVAHVWSLYAKAFEILGSNQLAASATAPAGLESGRALEQLADEESERFMTVSRHWEYVMGEVLVRQFIRVAKELDEELKADGKSEGFVLHSPGSRETVRIKWDDVNMDEEGYLIQVFPTSVLPTTPAARIDEVQRLADSQWIDSETAIRLLALPDLKSETDLVTADAELLEYQLGCMLEDGEPCTPYSYQNLKRAMVRTQQAIMRAETDGVPEAHIDLARDFLAMVVKLAPPAVVPAQPQPATAEAPAPPPAPMPAAPATPPVPAAG